jgi:RluA family pseudouridine synthase
MDEQKKETLNEPFPGNVDIIYLDAEIAVLNKPALLPVIPQRFAPLSDTLTNRLWHYLMEKEHRPAEEVRPFVVHRLDRDTSGVIVFARTPEIHRFLSVSFEGRDVEKEYLAVVEGRPDPPEGEINLPIGPPPKPSHKTRGKVFANVPDAKPAQTSYELVETFARASLVSVKPHTGRRHQIRVHMASIACLLFIDPLYGGRNRYPEDKPVIERLSLHAHKLSFPLPNGERRTFSAPLPGDMEALISLLRWQGLSCKL